MHLNIICGRLVILSILLAAPVADAGLLTFLKGPASLTEVEAEVDQDFPRVHQVNAKSVAQMMRNNHRLIILDVRQPEEFAVSHLKGARQVSPDADAREVDAVIGPHTRDATILMYCSVGYRSSKLADRVQAALLTNGAASIDDLRGGIFGWYNAGRPVFNAEGETHHVHPYNARWGKLLKSDPAPTNDTTDQ